MTDEKRHDAPRATEGPTPNEPEGQSIERAMHSYAAYLSSVERFQRSVVDFRRARASYESLQSLLAELAATRAAAAAERLMVRSAIRDYVLRLRAEERTPEVALRMIKRTCRAVVLTIPQDDTLRNPDALLADTVRWAIEAYYEAA